MISHAWAFKIGNWTSTSNHPNPIHTFESGNSTKTIEHTIVIELNGQQTTYFCTQEVTFWCSNTCGENTFAYNVSNCTASFTAFSSGSQLWDFGDGTLPTSATNPTHTYATDGDYLVTFTLNGFVCRKTIRVACEVPQPCCESFTASLERECSVLRLKLNPDCNAGTHKWKVETVPANTCMTLSGFDETAPDQNVQITNINTVTVTALKVTHEYTCHDGTTTTAIQALSTNNLAGIFIGLLNNMGAPSTTKMTDYECVLPGPGYNGSTVVYVSGIVEVDKPFEFASADIRMHREAGFDVKGHTFTLRQQTVVQGNPDTEDCPCLWRGIYVYSGEIASGSSSSRTTIKDALYAVRVFGGSTVSVRNTDFFRNYIGFRATNGHFITNIFEGNAFDGTGPLKQICALSAQNDVQLSDIAACNLESPQYFTTGGYSGMYLRNLPGFNPPSLAFSKQNIFSNLAVGIDAYDCNIKLIRFARFKNFDTGTYGGLGNVGIRITDSDAGGGNNFKFIGNGKYTSHPEPDFRACDAGVVVKTCGVVQTNVQVSGSRMLNMYTGILLRCLIDGASIVGHSSNASSQGVFDNYIQINKPPFFVSWPATGISFQDWSYSANSRIGIYKNDVWVNIVSTVNPGSSGIFVLGFITADEDYGLFQVDVYENFVQVDQGSFGVYVAQYKEVHVHDHGEPMLPGIIVNSSNATGIYVAQKEGNLIACNEIQVNSNSNTRGINIFNHEDGRIVRNHVTGGQVGVAFTRNCGTATKFACNIMENNSQYGLYYVNSDAQTGPQGSGSPNFVTHGNQWISSPAIGAYSANPAVPTHSRYYVKNNASENPIADPSPLWFFNAVPSNIAPTCYFDCPLPAAQFPFAPEITELDEAIARDTIVDSFGLNRWWNRYNLYKKLVYSPSLAETNALLSDFRDSMAVTPIGSLVAVLKAIGDLDTLLPVQRDLLNTYTAESVDLLEQLYQLDSLLADTSATSSQIIQWQNQSDSLLTALEAVGTAAQSVAGQLSAARQSEIPTILGNLEAISPEHVFEEDLKTLLRFFIHAALLQEAPDSTQLESIHTIATTCPSANGPFAFWAGSLYGHYTGVILSEPDCSAEYRQSDPVGPYSARIKEHQALAVKFWPNPADDLLMFSVEGLGSADHVRYLLTNALGHLCMEGSVGVGSNRIGVAQLPNGLYALQIQTEKGSAVSRTILIAHK